MIKRWAIYILVLLASYIFFIFYRLWVAWYILALVIVLPLISLLIGAIRFIMIRTDMKLARTVLRNRPVNIEIFDTASKQKKDDEDQVNLFNNYDCIFEIEDDMAGSVQKKIYNSKGLRDFKIPVDTSHCGHYVYTFRSIRYYDFLGLFRFTRKLNKRSEISVMPIESAPDTMPRLDTYKTKSYKKSRSPYSEIYDIREYREGDSMKNIHWKMTAKKGDIMVREPLDEDLQNARLVLRLLDNRDMMDRILDEFVFISKYFLNHGVSHRVEVVASGNDNAIRNVCYDVHEETEINKMIDGVLSMRLPEKVNHEK